MKEDDLIEDDSHFSFISGLTSWVHQVGYQEYISLALTLYSSKNECAMTDTVFLPISQVCTKVVTLPTLRARPEYQLSADIHSHKAGTKYPDE